MIEESEVRGEIQTCIDLARTIEADLAAGDRLSAARGVIALVQSYDRVMDNIRLTALALGEQEAVRNTLTPVAELLKKYRIR
ncbi:MAG: hypothetical protein U0Q18_35175 [Bryobacteraceae bacterium]